MGGNPRPGPTAGGFSLPEVLIAGGIAIVLGLVLAAAYAASLGTLEGAWDRAGLQQDVRRAMRWIRRDVEAASPVAPALRAVLVPGPAQPVSEELLLSLREGGGFQTVRYYQTASGDLYRAVVGAGEPPRRMAQGVSGFRVERLDDSSVRLEFRLSRGAASSTRVDAVARAEAAL